MIPKKLKVFVFFFATFFAGVFVGAATVDLLNQDYSIEVFDYPNAPSSAPSDLLETNYVAWNDGKDLTTAPVATDHLWVEPMYGVKLLTRYEVIDGEVSRDIYAFPSKKEIYGHAPRTPYTHTGSGSGR